MDTFYKVFFIALFMGIIPFSCTKDDCNLEPVPDFQIQEFEIEKINPVSNLILSDTTFYAQDSVIQKIFFSDTKYVKLFKLNSFSFNNTAYACSPAIPHSFEDLKTIKITSNITFMDYSSSDSIQPGDDITNKFILNIGYRANSRSFRSFSDILDSKRILSQGDNIFIKLANPIYQPISLDYNITITLGDSTRYIIEDQILNVKGF